MSLFSPAELERLVELYMFANTPSFIWSRFKADTAVIFLSERKTSEELIKAFDYINLPADDPTVLAEAYAILVAYCLQQPSNVELIKKHPNVVKLDWGPIILQLTPGAVITSSVELIIPCGRIVEPFVNAFVEKWQNDTDLSFTYTVQPRRLEAKQWPATDASTVEVLIGEGESK